MNISHMGCDRELSSRCGKSPSGHCPTQRNNQLERRRRPDSSHSRFYCRTLINRMTAPGPEGEHDPCSEERRYSGLFSSDTKYRCRTARSRRRPQLQRAARCWISHLCLEDARDMTAMSQCEQTTLSLAAQMEKENVVSAFLNPGAHIDVVGRDCVLL